MGFASIAKRTLLIDIDNSATVGAMRSMFSKSDDMQELIRRLCELAARYGFTLRPVHTPGALLHRPDQTSRGAQVEEPRVRLRSQHFKALEATHGPFSEFIGAERAMARREAGRDGPKLWAHPSFDTVGSTMGRICERVDIDTGRSVSGISSSLGRRRPRGGRWYDI